MKYGIQSLKAAGAYVWRHETLAGAMKTAEEMARNSHVDFIVFEIVGTFSNKIEWVESNAELRRDP